MPEFPQFVLRKYLDVVGLAVVGERLVAQHGIIVGVDQAGQGRRGGEADIGRERNFQVAFAAAFGRHDDDAVGTAHAVHGRRRSILEHVDVLHIVRVEHVEGRHVAHDAVDDDQRVLVAGIRPHAAHADRGLFAGFAGLLDGGHTGDTPNEGIGNIGHGERISSLPDSCPMAPVTVSFFWVPKPTTTTSSMLWTFSSSTMRISV